MCVVSFTWARLLWNTSCSEHHVKQAMPQLRPLWTWHPKPKPLQQALFCVPVWFSMHTYAYKPSNFYFPTETHPKPGIHSESGKLRSHCSHCSESQVCLCVCVEPLWETVPALKTQLSRLTFLFLLQPANTKLADTTHTSVLHRNTLPNNTVPTSNGCPLQQWTEGQPLPVQSIHERYNANQCNQLHVLLEAAGNATSSRPCLNFHLFGHGIQSQSLYRGRVSRIFCELVLIFSVCAFWLKQFRRHWPLSLFQQLQKLCCACYRAQSSLLACVFVPPTQALPKSQWKEYI